MIIAVDFDDTIAKNAYPDCGEFLPEAIRVLKRFQSDEHKLLLFTCREGQSLDLVVGKMAEAGLVFDAVNSQVAGYEHFGRKPYYDLLIDDRAWPRLPVDWDAIERWFYEPHLYDVTSDRGIQHIIGNAATGLGFDMQTLRALSQKDSVPADTRSELLEIANRVDKYLERLAVVMKMVPGILEAGRNRFRKNPEDQIIRAD